jgi:hypothetical protein
MVMSMTSDHLKDDYRLLLRDGIVMHHSGSGDRDAWMAALRDLAATDGFGVGVCYTLEHWGGKPCVELLGRDGGRYPVTSGDNARDQDGFGSANRLFAEEDWGELLEAARRRHGVEASPLPKERIKVHATAAEPVTAETTSARFRLGLRHFDEAGVSIAHRESSVRIVTFAADKEKWFPGKNKIIAAWKAGGVYAQIGQTVFVPSKVLFPWLVEEAIRHTCRSETGCADPCIALAGDFALSDDDPAAVEARREIEALTIVRS